MKNNKKWLIPLIIVLIILFPIGIGVLIWYFLFYKKQDHSSQKPTTKPNQTPEIDDLVDQTSKIKIDAEQTMKPSTSIVLGKKQTLKVVVNALNNANLTYQWFKNSSSDASKFTKIDNAETNTLDLVVNNAQEHDNQIYKCVVSNSKNNEKLEISTQISVIVPIIEIVKNPTLNKVYKIGDSLNIPFEANIQNQNLNSNWILSYQWFKKNGEAWQKLESNHEINSVDTNTLTIVKLSDSLLNTELTCVPYIKGISTPENNLKLTENKTIKLTIQQPSIESVKIVSNELSSQNRIKHDARPELLTNINLNGYSELPNGYKFNYKWIAFVNGSSQEVSHDYSWRVSEIIRNNQSIKVKVKVTILNSGGETISTKSSEEIKIKVNPELVVNSYSQNLNILKHHSIIIEPKFTINSSDSDQIVYKWQFNGREITNYDNRYSNQNTKALVINKTLNSDEGTYSLVVYINGLKYENSLPSISLKVHNNPPIITGISYEKSIKKLIRNNNGFTVKFTGTPQVNYSIPNAKFVISWFKENDRKEFELLSNGNDIAFAHTNEINFRNVISNQKYRLKFQVKYVDKEKPLAIYGFYHSDVIEVDIKKL